MCSNRSVLSLAIGNIVIHSLSTKKGVPASFSNCRHLEGNGLLVYLFSVSMAPEYVNLVGGGKLSDPTCDRFALRSGTMTRCCCCCCLVISCAGRLLRVTGGLHRSLARSRLNTVSIPIPPIRRRHGVTRCLSNGLTRIGAVVRRGGRRLAVLSSCGGSLVCRCMANGGRIPTR